MKKNLKQTTEELGDRMVEEFVKEKAYNDCTNKDFDLFKTMCQWMDGIVELYEDVEKLKKENIELKKALEKKS